MNRLIATIVLITTGSLSLGAGCAPKTVSSQADSTTSTMGRDSVIMPTPAQMPTDLVQDGEITLNAPATFTTMTVAEVSMLRATTSQQLEAAERAASSGAYLGDPVRVARIVADDSPGVLSYEVGTDLGTAFETDFLVRFQDGGGDVSFEIVGEPSGAGRRMPSMFRADFRISGAADGNSVVLYLGDGGIDPSELGRTDLSPFVPDEFACRIGVRYEPGSITILLNGEIVLEEVARLAGGNATAAILAHPAETAYVLSWTFETLP